MALYEFTNMGSPASELRCVGFQQLTVSTISLALTVPANAIYAYITVDAQPVRFRLDATAPTAAIGQPLVANDVVFLSGADLINRFRVIRSAAADSILNIHYFQ